MAGANHRSVMRVMSIDGCDAFLPTLAEAISDGRLWPGGQRPDDPLALADVTVFLPTRRAARALGEAILAGSGQRAAVLPRIEALGEGDDEEATGPEVLGDVAGRASLAALIPPFLDAIGAEVDPAARVLSRASGAELVRLAGDLLALMDQVETQGADWADLPGLVPEADLAEHWRITTRFLEVATGAWPQFLAATGRVSPATRRRETAEAAARQVAHARGPMIVAGSTGSIPATRALIRTIAESPWGAVVLPAFDRFADEDAVEAVRSDPDGPGHPQYGMIQLLDALDVAPADVVRLAPAGGYDREKAREGERRARLLAAACRPAARTDLWLRDREALGADAALADALDGVALVEAPDERQEAFALAIALRESVARGESAALMTPDRGLARRVKHVLGRWALEVDDSAGEPLAGTAAGQLVRLIATVAAGGAAAEHLALAKHPVLAGRVDTVAVEMAFRGQRMAGGAVLSTLALKGGGAAAFAGLVSEALDALLALAPQRASTGVLAASTAAAFDALCAPAEPLEGAAMVRDMLADLATGDGLSVGLRDWPGALEALMDGLVQRGPAPDGAVAILGPLEARLMAVDHAVLGGLNEGTWPAAPDAGPWMSRAMMSAFGLDLPERRLGLAAHDVMTAMQRPRVTLGRALLAAGEPTVASRWWQRVTAFAGDAAEPAFGRGRRLLDFVAALDAADTVPPAPRPEPRPSVAARPKVLRVTEVGPLVRDPYAVYAKRVLQLEPLDPLDRAPHAGDRGSLIHDVMRRFAADAEARGTGAREAYQRAVAAALRALNDAPDAKALWGARLNALTDHVVAWESARPPNPLVEVKAESVIAGDGRLIGRIDRLDTDADGRVAVLDYKTGRPPSPKQVAALLEPQLPLEAALVMAGAVEGIPAAPPLGALVYVQLTDPKVPISEVVVSGGDEAVALAQSAMAALERLYRHYQLPTTGYLSRARVPFEADQSGDYDHLARVAEWQR